MMVDQLPGPGVKGGPKQKWIKEHEALILDYLSIFGAKDTMRRFNLKKTTVQRLEIEGDRKRLPANDKDIIIRRINDLSIHISETDKLVRELQTDYGQFVPEVADNIKHKFLEPLIRTVISLPPGYDAPEIPDPLKIEDIEVIKPTSRTK